MTPFSRNLTETRSRNAKALAVFGARISERGDALRVVRQGTKATVYTVGYEKRDGDELMSLLRDQGIKALADVREKPMSRKADFRAAALKAYCEEAEIEYQSWSCLGSTVEQREGLQESGDFQAFAKIFRAHAKRSLKKDLDRLVQAIRQKPMALLCYERDHFACHRSVIAELVAEAIDASVIAL